MARLFPRKASIIILLPLLFLFQACNPTPPEVEPVQNHLIVIGEDLSQTFRNFTPITIEDLEAICNTFQKNKVGGKILLFGIGSSTPKGYVSCIIKPQIALDKTKTVSQQYREKAKNQAIVEKNRESIDAFLADAKVLLGQRNQPFTDINGFFEKAAVVIESPGYENHHKWLFVNTDGKQDTKRSNQVNCKLLPQVDQFSVSGWKAKPDCKPEAKFLAPGEFVQYLQSQL
jgi:hypothetical protein